MKCLCLFSLHYHSLTLFLSFLLLLFILLFIDCTNTMQNQSPLPMQPTNNYTHLLSSLLNFLSILTYNKQNLEDQQFGILPIHSHVFLQIKFSKILMTRTICKSFVIFMVCTFFFLKYYNSDLKLDINIEIYNSIYIYSSRIQVRYILQSLLFRCFF